MFKRVRWAMLGAAAGVGGSIWAQRRVRRSVSRYLPDQVGSQVRARVTRTAGDLRAAVGEGRAAMAEREAELRGRLPGDPKALPPRRGDIIEARTIDVERQERAE